MAAETEGGPEPPETRAYGVVVAAAAPLEGPEELLCLEALEALEELPPVTENFLGAEAEEPPVLRARRPAKAQKDTSE
jgi:hypothetical protein